MPARCTHLNSVTTATRNTDGCEECLKTGDTWVHLRLCEICGHVGLDLPGVQSAFEAALRISRRNGDNRSMADACLGLACLAGDAGDWDRAAVLHGVAQVLRDRTGNPWQELDARYRQNSLDQARAHLGDEQLERAYAQGRALSLDQALRRPDPG